MFLKRTIIGVMLIALHLFLILGVEATSYGTGPYSCGLYGEGCASNGSSNPGGDSGGGGGGGGGGSAFQCREDRECATGQLCIENACIKGNCRTDNECNTAQGEVCWFNTCLKLFDIKIVEFDSQIQRGNDFGLSYFMKGVANISGDVEIDFWIENENGTVTSGKDTIYIGNYEEKTETVTMYMPTTVPDGVYTLKVRLKFGGYEANSHRTIEILTDEKTNTYKITEFKPPQAIIYTIWGWIILMLISILVLIYFLRKVLKHAKKRKEG